MYASWFTELNPPELNIWIPLLCDSQDSPFTHEETMVKQVSGSSGFWALPSPGIKQLSKLNFKCQTSLSHKKQKPEIKMRYSILSIVFEQGIRVKRQHIHCLWTDETFIRWTKYRYCKYYPTKQALTCTMSPPNTLLTHTQPIFSANEIYQIIWQKKPHSALPY